MAQMYKTERTEALVEVTQIGSRGNERRDLSVVGREPCCSGFWLCDVVNVILHLRPINYVSDICFCYTW